MINTIVNFLPFYQQSMLLAISSILSIALLAFRIYSSKSSSYIFLYWNLFLAIIPYILSLLIYKYYFQNAKKPVFFLLIGFWLLFFPNAPYIVTDLIHLKKRSGFPHWYDTL